MQYFNLDIKIYRNIYLKNTFIGLDPAGPLFNIFLPSLSLNNAQFVDIIHTDSGYYGIGKSTGTVDFFPNGGKRVQPGCPYGTEFMSNAGILFLFQNLQINLYIADYIFHFSIVFISDFCSHKYSWKFYAESLINESAFIGVKCSSLSRLLSGECYNNTQIVMGYATPSNASVKKFYTLKK